MNSCSREAMTMNRIDQEALQRAIQMAKANDPGRRQQLESMLTDRPWREVAEFASFCCQTASLCLKPWEWPPCWSCDDYPRLDDHRGQAAAWRLRRRLIAAGLSEFEPDPAAALERVHQRAEAPPVERREQVH
jgi:hypothetical protein